MSRGVGIVLRERYLARPRRWRGLASDLCRCITCYNSFGFVADPKARAVAVPAASTGR
jgi:hypothetical protein